jgi:hypothetical protein
MDPFEDLGPGDLPGPIRSSGANGPRVNNVGKGHDGSGLMAVPAHRLQELSSRLRYCSSMERPFCSTHLS